MKAFLLFLSSIFASAILIHGEIQGEVDSKDFYEAEQMQECSLPKEECNPSQLNANKKYMFEIEMDKGYVSGIMILHETDDEVKGSMINEFGVSALDFVYTKKSDKLKLLHVISFLNKWYVKQVLRNDIRLGVRLLSGLATSIPKNYILQTTGDTLSLTNKKRGIQYRFELSK